MTEERERGSNAGVVGRSLAHEFIERAMQAEARGGWARGVEDPEERGQFYLQHRGGRELRLKGIAGEHRPEFFVTAERRERAALRFGGEERQSARDEAELEFGGDVVAVEAGVADLEVGLDPGLPGLAVAFVELGAEGEMDAERPTNPAGETVGIDGRVGAILREEELREQAGIGRRCVDAESREVRGIEGERFRRWTRGMRRRSRPLVEKSRHRLVPERSARGRGSFGSHGWGRLTIVNCVRPLPPERWPLRETRGAAAPIARAT